jgi:hypothetical protein
MFFDLAHHRLKRASSDHADFDDDALVGHREFRGPVPEPCAQASEHRQKEQGRAESWSSGQIAHDSEHDHETRMTDEGYPVQLCPVDDPLVG